MIRIALLVTLVAAFVAWFGSSVEARPAGTAFVAAANGTLTVKTVDQVGKAVAGARVNVFPSGSSTPAATGTTDASGKASFSLAPGSYSICASKVIVVSCFPMAIFGSGSATVSSGQTTGVTIVLGSFAP